MKHHLLDPALKGTLIGASMLIPGVSGGTMAIILGIYGRLIDAVGGFFHDVRKNLLFLFTFCCGALVGILLFAKPLAYLNDAFPMPMIYFFIGAIGGSIPLLCQKAGIDHFTPSVILYPILGAILAALIGKLPQNLFQFNTNMGAGDYFLLLGAGIAAAIALVLPGISVSYLLLVMGLYTPTVDAVNHFNLPFLLPLAIGVLLGIILTTKLLEKALRSFPKQTYLLILGFVIWSIIEVFPGFPVGWNTAICILAFAAGAVALYAMSKREL